MIQAEPNPLLKPNPDPTADLTRLESSNVFRRGAVMHRRELRDLRRIESAAEAIDGFDRETWVYGFTKGQFSVIDLLRALLGYAGPARLDFSTWTAANADVTTVLEFVDEGLVTGARWLVDLTFQRRSPELAKRIRDVFGPDAIRVAKNHAKFALLGNEEWQIVVHTSMNLNFNPRFENFSIAHDPELYAFHAAILNEIWNRQERRLSDARPYEIHRYFNASM